MSWFKKIFGSQYGFSSQSSSQGSLQGSSQEPKVSYAKEKTETDSNEIEILTISEIQKCDDTTQSTQDSCYSWSSVSQDIDVKGEKRELLSDDDNEESWWESFKSQSTQKSTQNTQLQEFKSSQAKAEASSSQDDNKSNDEEEKKDDEKICFYSKLRKYKKFKYM